MMWPTSRRSEGGSSGFEGPRWACCTAWGTNWRRQRAPAAQRPSTSPCMPSTPCAPPPNQSAAGAPPGAWWATSPSCRARRASGVWAGGRTRAAPRVCVLHHMKRCCARACCGTDRLPSPASHTNPGTHPAASCFLPAPLQLPGILHPAPRQRRRGQQPASGAGQAGQNGQAVWLTSCPTQPLPLPPSLQTQRAPPCAAGTAAAHPSVLFVPLASSAVLLLLLCFSLCAQYLIASLHKSHKGTDCCAGTSAARLAPVTQAQRLPAPRIRPVACTARFCSHALICRRRQLQVGAQPVTCRRCLSRYSPPRAASGSCIAAGSCRARDLRPALPHAWPHPRRRPAAAACRPVSRGQCPAHSRMAAAGYFSADRRAKYGWGTLRLAFWVAFAFAAAPRLQAAYAGGGSGDWASSPHWRATADYLRSWRWLGHAYLGAMGAVVSWAGRSRGKGQRPMQAPRYQTPAGQGCSRPFIHPPRLHSCPCVWHAPA